MLFARKRKIMLACYVIYMYVSLPYSCRRSRVSEKQSSLLVFRSLTAGLTSARCFLHTKTVPQLSACSSLRGGCVHYYATDSIMPAAAGVAEVNEKKVCLRVSTIIILWFSSCFVVGSYCKSGFM